MTTHAATVGHLDAMGEGPGFRKVRRELGVEAFGVNGLVLPPGGEGFWHHHETQDELYFVHAGRMRVEVGDPAAPEVHELDPGGLAHVPSTTPRRISAIGDEELVVLVIGAADGYVGRDGMLEDLADLERRRAMGSGEG